MFSMLALVKKQKPKETYFFVKFTTKSKYLLLSGQKRRRSRKREKDGANEIKFIKYKNMLLKFRIII